MNIILYGTGKRFRSFIDCKFYAEALKRHDYHVVGVYDKAKAGEQVTVDDGSFVVGTQADCVQGGSDCIAITSDKYFDEIAGELTAFGVAQERLVRLSEIETELEDDVYTFQRFDGRYGIEIGGPSHCFAEVYRRCRGCDDVNFSADTVWWKKEENVYRGGTRVLGKVFIADAVDLSMIADAKYDFVLSSNNLEHIANPLKAVAEFVRILKPGGYLVIVVPFKEKTFDHRRPYTAFEHLLEDYKRDIDEDDLTHLPEIAALHDYEMDPPCGGRENFLRRSKENFKNRCLHQHVFSEESLRGIYDYFQVEVLSFACVGANLVCVGERAAKSMI